MESSVFTQLSAYVCVCIYFHVYYGKTRNTLWRLSSQTAFEGKWGGGAASLSSPNPGSYRVQPKCVTRPTTTYNVRRWLVKKGEAGDQRVNKNTYKPCLQLLGFFFKLVVVVISLIIIPVLILKVFVKYLYLSQHKHTHGWASYHHVPAISCFFLFYLKSKNRRPVKNAEAKVEKTIPIEPFILKLYTRIPFTSF